jgi:molybdopterin-guanine dinucleotide biosynthesis protein A
MVSKANNFPVLNGLVLAGGKSLRMSKPKDKINWHGKEQRYYLADILAPFCDQVYISCRQDQAFNLDPNYELLKDAFSDLGPLGGVLSAFKSKPNQAWLVVACDMPFLDADCFEFLIQSRNADKIATAYQNPIDNLPEPLITIWEPKSYPILNDSFALGNTSLRKFLINNDTLIIKPLKPEILLNINTPEEMLKAAEILKNR